MRSKLSTLCEAAGLTAITTAAGLGFGQLNTWAGVGAAGACLTIIAQLVAPTPTGELAPPTDEAAE